MRVAIAISKFDPHHGGAESWTMQLAMWLKRRGHEVHVVSQTASDDVSDSLGPDRVHVVGLTGNRLKAAKRVAEWLHSRSFDVVHDMGVGYQFDLFHPHFGSWNAMEQARRKMLSTSQRFAKQLMRPFARRQQIVETLSRKQFSHPTASYVAVSQMVAADLKRCEGIPTERIHTIPNGVDVALFHPVERARLNEMTRRRFGIADGAMALSLIAHNHRLKGVPQALDVLAQASDFPVPIHLLIVGGHRQAYRRVHFGKHQASFVGTIENMLPVYAATDVYLHPTFYDACCLAVLEAMACGIPTITTRCNGASQAIEDRRNGFIVDSPLDSHQILDCLRLLVDPVVRWDVGTAARDTAEAWTLENNFLAVEALYASLKGKSLRNTPGLDKRGVPFAAEVVQVPAVTAVDHSRHR
jgi:UDP-glucose:(heptosyl)LPS alpha-1,3-glucosyltransferase